MSYEELERLARKASPGPWAIESVWVDEHSGADCVRAVNQVVCTCDEHDGGYGGGQRNVEYLAALAPEVVLELIALARLHLDALDVAKVMRESFLAGLECGESGDIANYYARAEVQGKEPWDFAAGEYVERWLDATLKELKKP